VRQPKKRRKKRREEKAHLDLRQAGRLVIEDAPMKQRRQHKRHRRAADTTNQTHAERETLAESDAQAAQQQTDQ